MFKGLYINREKFHRDIAFYLMMAIAFLLPFKFLVPSLIALLTINWLLEGNFKTKLLQLKKAYVWLFLLFYLLHIAALTYTQNKAEGLTALEVKLSFLIFPLLFSTISFSRKQLQYMLKAFIAGCISSMAVCLIRAIFLYLTKNEIHFFYMELSWFMHPGYFSLYLSFASFILLASLFYHHGFRLPLKLKLYFITLIVCISIFILLLAAKLGIIVYFSLLLVACVSEFIYRKKYKLLGILSITALLLFIGIFTFVPGIQQRFQNMLIAVQTEAINKSSSESTEVRMLIWDVAKELVKENPMWGVGPGDSNDELYKKYEEKGYTGALEHRLNAHNQYFQTLLDLGLAGLLLLFLQLLLSLIKGFSQKKQVLRLLVWLMAFHFFTESMLQTQAGVIFYAFFISLLLLHEWDGTLTENKVRLYR